MVDALQRIHSALNANGLVIDTQPVSSNPPVSSVGYELGKLDMREWLETIRAVDRRVAEPIQAGLYSLEHEESFGVTDTWESGPECVETIANWQGTRIAAELEARIRGAPEELRLDQVVRLRLLRVR